MFLWEKAMEQFSISAINAPDLQSFSNTQKIKLQDVDGYRYYLSRQNLGTIAKRGKLPARFFNLNQYTEYNIRLYLSKISNNDVILVDFNAENAHDPLALFCISQNHSYTKSWNLLQRGDYKLVSMDADYKNPRIQLDISDVKLVWEEKFDITVIDTEYTNNCTPIKYICNKHADGGVQEATWASALSAKHLCKYCAQESVASIHINRGRVNFYNKLDTQKHPDITMVGEYVGKGKKIACVCRKCGTEFSLRPDHILRGIGCGKCTVSIGERKVREYLNTYGIQFDPQHVFDDCKVTWKPMPFDFFLPDLSTAIEFDGEQHFRSVDHFGGQEEFARLQKRDRFKTEYCKSNNINLIRIPYTDINNIEQYIEPLAKAALSLRQNTP